MIVIAQIGLIVILSIFLVFHFLILFKIIPYTIVWGGRLKTDKEMYRFESVSVLLNFFFLLIILAYSNVLTISIPTTVMTIILWIMAALFAFNTLGNITSKNKLEKTLFTPITILLTMFSLILALQN